MAAVTVASARCGPWLVFYKAIQDNDLCVLKRLVRKHHNVIDLNRHFTQAQREVHLRLNPIHLATYLGHTDILRYLLEEQHCDIEMVTVKQGTAFHIAVTCRQLDCFHVLLSAGCDLDPVDMFSNSPLHYAAEDGACDMLDLLLQRGAKVDSRDISLKTPLMKATRGGRVGAVNKLLLAGCAVNTADQNQDTAMHFASRHGDCDLLNILISSGGNIDAQNCTGRTPLLEALSYNNQEAAKQLMETGCDVNLQEYITKDTALHVAVRKGNTSLIDLLLGKLGISNTYNINNELPVHWAVISNNLDIIRVFLNNNYDLSTHIKIASGVGKNGGEVAYECGHVDLLKLFHELGLTLDNALRPNLAIVSSSVLRQCLRQCLLVTQQVPTLRALCRKSIRKCIGRGLEEKILALPLPLPVKDYLLLKDLKTQHLLGLL